MAYCRNSNAFPKLLFLLYKVNLVFEVVRNKHKERIVAFRITPFTLINNAAFLPGLQRETETYIIFINYLKQYLLLVVPNYDRSQNPTKKNSSPQCHTSREDNFNTCVCWKISHKHSTTSNYARQSKHTSITLTC